MTSLAERLKTSTRPIHLQVERSAFMQALFRGQLSRAGYCLFLRSLFEIYSALEEALRAHAQLPSLAPLVMPKLFRSEQLAADLGAMHGPNWRTELAITPEAAAYAAHLRALSQTQPELLGAHVYVRSLGDLSGGQILQKVISETLSPVATSFYDFGPEHEVQLLAQTLRSGLKTVPLASELAEEAFVKEASASFERHRVLFGELAAAAGI